MANKRAKGRPRVLYEHPESGKRLDAHEWASVLGLANAQTFYARVRCWKNGASSSADVFKQLHEWVKGE